MWNLFQTSTATATADTTTCRRITIPDLSHPNGWRAGQVVRLLNFLPERASWISDLLQRSEPCADPGDNLCTSFDVETVAPNTPMDFSDPQPIYLADVFKKYGWDELQLRRALDHLNFPKGRVVLLTGGGTNAGAIGSDRVWDCAEQRKIAIWDEHRAACFPTAR